MTDSIVGAVLADRYRVDALIAEGGMGRVFVGEHIMMQKKVAIKVLRRSLTRVPEVVARFEREAMAAANIEHQNIAAATDFGKLDDGSVFLVLEYIEGTSLRDVLQQGPLPLRRTLHIVRQIASALAAAHALNIVHRDLKPENVMLLERGADKDFVKVLDFGIAKVPPPDDDKKNPESRDITNPGIIVGTPEYMAPEQSLGQDVDARADVYSVGIMFFEMLAGKVPFDSEKGILGQQLTGVVPRVREKNPSVQVPEAVDELIASLLVRDTADRIQSAREALRGIDALISEYEKTASGKAVAGTVRSFGSEPETIPLIHASAEVQRAVQDSVAELRSKADALAEKLPAPLRSLHPAILLGLPVALLLLVAVLLFSGGEEGKQADAPKTAASAVSAAASATETPAPTAPSDRATDEELSVAQAAGLTVLTELSEKYPKDSRIVVSLALLLSKKQRHVEAVIQIKKALDLFPDIVSDPQVATVLWAGTQSKARTASFELLLGPMGAKGADIIYDLATTPGVRSSTKDVAIGHLEDKVFARNATPEASIAADLFTAKSCRVRKALLKRAENVGDARSLETLKRFRDGKGCASEEETPCNGCLTEDPGLPAAIEVLEKRAAEAKAAAAK